MAITFKATFAPLESAIKISSEGGMRITLDIPESDVANALYLLELRNQVFIVSIDSKTEKNNAISKRTNRKSQWTPTQE